MSSSVVREDARPPSNSICTKKMPGPLEICGSTIKLCWSDVVLQAADDAKDASEVRTKIVPGILQDGSITASFERKGKGKMTYSNRQHTCDETK
jgi:hypothetical protein